jgi:hypothetical protein
MALRVFSFAGDDNDTRTYRRLYSTVLVSSSSGRRDEPNCGCDI